MPDFGQIKHKDGELHNGGSSSYVLLLQIILFIETRTYHIKPSKGPSCVQKWPNKEANDPLPLHIIVSPK